MSKYWFHTYNELSPEIRIHILEENDWNEYLATIRNDIEHVSSYTNSKPIVKIHFSCAIDDSQHSQHSQQLIDLIIPRLPKTVEEASTGHQELYQTPTSSEQSVHLYVKKLDPVTRFFRNYLISKCTVDLMTFQLNKKV